VKTTFAVLFTLALAAPASAQDDGLSFRPFVLGTIESFAAIDTFDAVYGRTYQPFLGGGLQVVQDSYFLELTASQMSQTGQRAFINNGQKFRLGIPLTAKILALEATAGYRYRLSPRVLPYGAAGVGLYRYQESSDFDEAGENVDARHTGFILNGGAEFRVSRWVGVAADVQYTHVPGILGSAGLSRQANENDLGGISGRLKIIVGK
jgi:opacity protein-like surface antigen